MEKYINRESSLLEFNARVLAEAMDSAVPLLERLKFTGIVSSNLDEFFMVRFPRIEKSSPAYNAVRKQANELITRQYSYFTGQLLPELEKAGINKLSFNLLNERQSSYINKLYLEEIFPVITPIALSDDRQFPLVNNLRTYIFVSLKKSGGAGGVKYALVEIPHNLPRIITLPGETGYKYILIEDIILSYAHTLFVGYELLEKGLFRITRAAELTVKEAEDEDFLKAMEEAVRQRRQGKITRLETDAPESLLGPITHKLDIDSAEIYKNLECINLKSFSSFAFQSGFEDLKYPAWEPKPVTKLDASEDIWQLLRAKDVLLHLPYESFQSIAKFVSQAADDIDVLAIKQTLYRAGSDSDIINALERAAQNGKQVTALVELKARFDEENNIGWAKQLEAAGASVIYGVKGLKTHAKACLVVRREHDGIRRYVHLATGNYNEKTARLYSDLGLFSSNDALTGDISAFFNMVTGYSHPAEWAKIEVAPYGLKKKLLRLIDREAMHSTKERPGMITAKMNSLVDTEIIDALYAASKAGVKIRLNVRGVCCLRAGVKDLSENIEVISIVDMFLEHSRIFCFDNRGDSEIYLSSADWMPRNLERRVEIMFPVEDKEIKRELKDLLDAYFKDNEKAWTLEPNNSYAKISSEGKKKFRAQQQLCLKAKDKFKALQKTPPLLIKPQRPVKP